MFEGAIWRVACPAACLLALAVVLQSCGGSSQPPAPLTITSTSLPNGTAEVQYNEVIQATGGVAPYHWSVSAGTPPHNLQLNQSNTNTDTISGTPDTPVQADSFSVSVTDASKQTAIQAYKVSILGVPDTLVLSPATLNFNPQLVGTASATQTMSLSNTGTTPVAINSVTAAGTNAGDFNQTNTCTGIAPEASCTITVTFTPGQAGPSVASITINDDTVGTPHTLGLNGIGLVSGANATLSGQDLSFGNQTVGTTSPGQTLTLTNYGTATLNIANVVAAGDFAESSTCAASLGSAGNCAISVTFTPSTTGSLSGTLTVTDSAPVNSQTVGLSGTGVQAACVPPGGQCSARGSCCPVAGYTDVCSAQHICVVE